MKRFLTVILSSILLLSSLTIAVESASPINGFVPAVSNPGSINVILNGMELQFDTEPIIQNDRTLVPLRGIMEALQYTVEWDGQTRQVTATKDWFTVVLTIDSTTAYVNGTYTMLDVAPCIRDSRTLVPLRFISEAINMDVAWNSFARTVFINDPATYETIYDDYGILRYIGQVDSLGNRCGYGVSYGDYNNVIYTGQWLNNEEHGIGAFTWESGIHYEGDCQFGQASGNGIMTFPDTGVYVGSFLWGDRSGYGLFRWINGDQYEGNWIGDKMAGTGTYTFADGYTMSGTWSGNDYMG